MELKNKIDIIIDRLSILSTEVTLRGTLNLLDVNVISEHLYNDILNIIYGWKLENANFSSQNIKAIDLIDNVNKIVVQVSSDNSKKKIQDSLDKLDSAKYNGYSFKFVSIAKKADNLKKNKFIVPTDIFFDAEEDIYDIKRIIRNAQALDADTIACLAEYLNKNIAAATCQKIRPSVITYVINCLSDIDLSEAGLDHDFKQFDFLPKVNINSLVRWGKAIEELSVYSITVDKIYSQYDIEAANKSTAVLFSLHKMYLKLKDQYQGDELFDCLLEIVYETVDGDETCNVTLTKEELEMDISIVLVDAFLKCRIFEKPE